VTARINTVIGRYWGGMVRVLDIFYLLAVFGMLGGLPPLLQGIAKYARYAVTSLREAQQRTGFPHLATGALTRDGSRPESPAQLAGRDITVDPMGPAAASR
jgi:hypothetical protein